MARSAWLAIAVIAALALAGTLAWWRLEGDAPAVEAPDEVSLGRAPKPIAVEIRERGSGLRELRAVLVHAKGESVLAEKRFPGSLWSGGGVLSERLELAPDVEKLAVPDGDARLRIELRDWSWRNRLAGNETVREVALHVDRRPPRVAVRSGLTYVRRGGAGLVVYRVGEPVVRDGVQVADRFFPGIEWPGACPEEPAGCRVALFAVPIDAPPEAPIQVVAEDAAGNTASSGWATRLQEREVPRIPIELTPGFLENKVRELAQDFGIADASPVAAFQEINRAQRARDEARIRELTSAVSGPPRWQGAFEQLADSEVTSVFPEYRSYRHDGQVVSEATHYGFDLASLAGAPITASNAGRVLFAGPLGIYGDTVLVDHGLGVVTLYGHLSAIEVQQGDEVQKGARLGLSGQTGLAGGDHLHFATLVAGSYVDPREWWDAKWVREHVDAILGR